MAEYLIQDTSVTAVANAIREKAGTSELLSFPDGFVTAIQGLSSGGELNYKIVGGVTEPSNPSENTIWVNTSATITNHVFDFVEPENPSEGTVWIELGDNSNIVLDVLQTNSIYTYLLSAKQYISGAWVFVTANIYQNGEWSELINTSYIIKDGTVDLTKYTYSYRKVAYNVDTTGGASDSVIKQAQSYNGNLALWLYGENGTWYYHSFANVEIPSFATTFHLDYYQIVCYGTYPTFNQAKVTLGDTEVLVEKGSTANTANDGTVTIDVTAMRGQTVTLTIACYGSSTLKDNYIGDVWFD